MTRQSAFEILEKIGLVQFDREMARFRRRSPIDLNGDEELLGYYRALMDKYTEPTHDLGIRLKREMDERKGRISQEEEEEARKYFSLDFDRSTRCADKLVRNYHPDSEREKDYLERAARLIIRAQDDLAMLRRLCSPAEYRDISEEGNPLPELKQKLHYVSNYHSAYDKLRHLCGMLFDAVDREAYDEALGLRDKIDKILAEGERARMTRTS